jgi:parallel beta-helix repeat protein
MTRRSRLAALIATSAAALALLPATATAQGVTCGQVITQDTRVENDLVNCPGPGLVIGADSITLDLAGHTIDGANGGIGIDAATRSGLTIERGTIREFGTGIFLNDTSASHLRRLTIRQTEIALDSPILFSNGTIVRNRFLENGTAVRLESLSDGNLIQGNVLLGNRAGILLRGSRDNRIVGNRLVGAQGTAGIELNGGFRTLVAHNFVSGSFNGIEIFSSRLFGDSEDNVLIGNRLQANLADGIFLQGPFEFPPGVVHPGAGRTVVERNSASENGDDGIDAENSTTTLRRNLANRNGDLGIEAVPGVIDGGGNRASGNGNPLQCVNVFCR